MHECPHVPCTDASDTVSGTVTGCLVPGSAELAAMWLMAPHCCEIAHGTVACDV